MSACTDCNADNTSQLNLELSPSDENCCGNCDSCVGENGEPGVFGLTMPIGFTVGATASGIIPVTTSLNGLIYGTGANEFAAVTLAPTLDLTTGLLKVVVEEIDNEITDFVVWTGTEFRIRTLESFSEDFEAVTSVGLALPESVFEVSGSPVTTTGTLTGAFKTQTAKTFFAGPVSGADAIPTFRPLDPDDIADALDNSLLFRNGLVKSGTTVKLGTNPLIEDTVINGASLYDLTVQAGNFLVRGTFGAGKTLSSYADVQMFFYPRKGAFRAGYANGGQWNDANIGGFSAAFGITNTIAGTYGMGWGSSNHVTTSGVLGTAWGNDNEVSGSRGTAWGQGNIVSGYTATGWGYLTIADAHYATASGVGSETYSYAGTVIGHYNDNTLASDPTSFQVTNRAFEIGMGTSDVARANAMTVLFNGNVGLGTTTPTELLSLGKTGTTKGVISFAGNTSGKVIIQPAAAAGTYTLTLPTTDGNAGEVLTTDGSGILSWTAVAGASGGTVTSFSFVDANGFAGSVANATTTPALTLSTSFTGWAYSNGTGLAAGTIGTGLTNTTGTLSWNGVDMRKNSTGSTFTRRRINLIEGANVTLTFADDAANDEIDVTIAAAGGAGGVYTDEEAQDAVGLIFTDSATINFTYDDATPSITGIVIDNSITDIKLRQSAGLSVIGRPTSSTGNVTDITAANNNEVLRRSGSTLGFGLLSNSSLVNSSISLAVANTGSDVQWSAASVSLGGTATLNVPDVSATARGVVNLVNQTMGDGIKTFKKDIYVYNSIRIGRGAGSVNTNLVFGEFALGANTTGFQNIGMGYLSMVNNTTGAQNIGIGYQTLQNNTTGGANIAIGSSALKYNLTGNYNIAIGPGALQNNVDDGYSVAIGAGALGANISTFRNTAVGNAAMADAQPDAYDSVGIGFNALRYLTTGQKNTAVGSAAMEETTTGYQNAAVGQDAMLHNTTGYWNVALGWLAGSLNSTGYSNTYIGTNTGRSLSSGYGNIFIGSGAGYNAGQLAGAENSIAIGLDTYTTASNQIKIGNDSHTATYLRGTIYVNDEPGTAGQVLTSQGLGLPPIWTTVSGGGGGGSVLSVNATDANGFDFTVTNPTTTPVISLTTTVGNTRVMYSNNGAVKGVAGFIFDDTSALTLGLAGASTGKLKLSGAVSGVVTVQAQSGAGNWTMTLPSSAGTDGYVLSTDGTGTTSWIPISGGGITGEPLTTVNDTNITLTLGGTPLTSLLEAVSITAGWTGVLSATRGGTGISSYTNGDLLYANSTTTFAKRGIGAEGYVLTVSGGVPVWAAAPGGGGGGGPVPISSLVAANITNSIDNLSYIQDWQWNTLADNYGLKLSTNSTTADDSQTLFAVLMSGANAGAGKHTYAAEIRNTHTGTDSVNHGVYVEASGAEDGNYSIIAVGNVGINNLTPAENLAIGSVLVGTGTMSLSGGTSGKVIIKPQDAAGSWTLTLPNSAGSPNYFLQTDGSGNTTWAAAADSGVTEVTASDLHGFNFTITDSTTTPNIELVTTVGHTQVVYSSNGDVVGAPGFIFDGSSTVTLGQAGTSLGQLKLTGNAAGTLTIRPGTNFSNYTLQLPDDGGTNNYFLKTNGSGVTSWAAVSASMISSGAALTKVDDTNVTLTLGGGHATSLLSATELTLGWTGVLSIARGGTNNGALSVAVGTVYYGDGTKLVGLAPGTSGHFLQTQGAGSAPIWAAATDGGFAFTDANGFDGTVTTPGGVPTLELTTTLTEGSVVFIGAAGALLQDNSEFFWDNTNKFLGIGTSATPAFALHVIESSAEGYAASIENSSDGGNGLQVMIEGPGDITTFYGGTGGATARFTFTGLGELILSGSFGTSGQVLKSNGPGAAVSWVTPTAGTVTSVAAGAGMDFTTFTTSGSVIMGTPSNITLSSTNSASGTTHTHAFVPGGLSTEYIRGDGTLATFPTTSSVSISNLTIAEDDNTINNADYLQEWQWNSLTDGPALKLSSTSTAAVDGQTLFSVALSGTNATTELNTYAGVFTNTHAGDGINHGLSVTASGGALNIGILATGDHRSIHAIGTVEIEGSLILETGGAATTINAAGNWTLTLPTNDGDNGQVLTTNGSGVTSWTTPSGSVTADNGLTMSTATNVQLGGTLLANTTINTSASYLKISTATAAVTPAWIVAGTGRALLVENASTNQYTGVFSNTSAYGGLSVSSGGGDALVVQTSSSGIAIVASTTDGPVASLSSGPASTNTVTPVLKLERLSSGTAAAGIGQSIDIYIESSTGASRLSHQLISKFSTATDASRVSEFVLAGVNNATTADLLTVLGSGKIRGNTYGAGTHTGTPTYYIQVDASGNFIEINTSSVTTYDGTGTLTNKTIALSGNTFSGTIAQFNTALTDADFATLAGAETLTNKTLTSPTLVTPVLGVATATSINKVTITAPTTSATLTLVDGSSLITAGAFAVTLTSTGTTNVTLPTTGTLVTRDGTETLTNKTLTSPVINTPTGIVKGDVGLGNVDNTSDATKNAASVTLTNKTIALGSNTISGTTAQFNTALTDGDFATLAGTETLSGKTLTAPRIASGGFIADANGNELIIFTTTASAVNELTIANMSTGANPKISMTGGDTNIGIDWLMKGTGSFNLLGNATQAAVLNFYEDTDNGTNKVSLTPVAALGSDVVVTLPNATGTLMIGANNLSELTSAGGARTNLGATTVGSNLFTLTNPSAITFLRVNADNTVTALSDSAFRTAISGASMALDNLASVAINASLLPATSDAVALGSTTKQWSDLYLAEGGVINWDNGDMTLTQANNVLTLAGGELVLGTIGTGAGAAATVDGIQTLTNKRITPRVGSNSSSSAPTPNGEFHDFYEVTALAEAATFGAPTGTPQNGQKLMIRIKDNGTARALAWNAVYRASSDLALPTTTIVSKTLYLGFVYNSADSKWDLIALLNNF